VPRVARWYQLASHGQTRFNGTVKGPYTLPQPLATYQVSPYNFRVDSKRVYALVRDALSLAEEDGVPLGGFDVVAVVHRCFTRPGQGYGMICYCANPGMISKVRQGRARYVPITTRRGTVFQKGVVVMAENFNLGFMVHDLAHAIGGVYHGTRLVPDLYDFAAQSRQRSKFQIHDAAIFMGPWDVMSQHFLTKNQPPPGFSLFTMMRLGYIQPRQVDLIRPGETALARLAPLAQGGPLLGVKIPLSGSRYLLVENRQPLKVDRVLPASGVMVYTVDESLDEGAGIVRAQNADPSAPNFSRAPFGVDGQAKAAFVDQGANVAVVPLIKEGQDYLVLITAAHQADAAQSVSRNLVRLQGTPDFRAKKAQALSLLKSGRIGAARELTR
jgi:M6 family metalloprotease-like protein